MGQQIALHAAVLASASPDTSHVCAMGQCAWKTMKRIPRFRFALPRRTKSRAHHGLHQADERSTHLAVPKLAPIAPHTSGRTSVAVHTSDTPTPPTSVAHRYDPHPDASGTGNVRPPQQAPLGTTDTCQHGETLEQPRAPPSRFAPSSLYTIRYKDWCPRNSRPRFAPLPEEEYVPMTPRAPSPPPTTIQRTMIRVPRKCAPSKVSHPTAARTKAHSYPCCVQNHRRRFARRNVQAHIKATIGGSAVVRRRSERQIQDRNATPNGRETANGASP